MVLGISLGLFFIFFGSVIKRYEKIEFVSLGATSFLAIDTSKIFGFLVMQDINKKEGVSHPFFLKFAGFVWTRSVSLSDVEKVSKSVQATKNLYPFFSFIFYF
jgi:hypothetical protein